MSEYADADIHNVKNASDPKLPKIHTGLAKRNFMSGGRQLCMNLDVNMKKKSFRRK